MVIVLSVYAGTLLCRPLRRNRRAAAVPALSTPFLFWCALFQPLSRRSASCYIHAMKKLLAVLLFVAFVSPAFGAGRHHHHHHHKHHHPAAHRSA
ncbi:MAG: hypothetical protein ACRD27_09795 [Terracidiphilus sp.]